MCHIARYESDYATLVAPCFAPSQIAICSSLRIALKLRVASSPSLPQISVARLASPPSSRAHLRVRLLAALASQGAGRPRHPSPSAITNGACGIKNHVHGCRSFYFYTHSMKRTNILKLTKLL